MYYGYIQNKENEIIDEVTMVQMPAGKSYTGQEQAEIFCHGGQYILKKILQEILKNGARMAEPGEFTRRAFHAGRIDLAKAEAVADLIASKTEYSYHAAKNNLIGELSQHIDSIRDKTIELLAEIEASIDYPEEELDLAEKNKQVESIDGIINNINQLIKSYQSGKILKEGFKIAIAGRPNAGKSSLFNLLLNQSRAIVTPTPGTTRDYLTEWIELEGFTVSITDTAGMRKSTSEAERSGQDFSEKQMKQADLILWMADISKKGWKSNIAEDLKRIKEIGAYQIILNKIDLLNNLGSSDAIPDENPILLSCKDKTGFARLKESLVANMNTRMPDLTERLIVTSERQKKKLSDSLKSLKKAKQGITNSDSPELIAFDLRLAVGGIDEVTGKIYTEEILDKIFSQFCLGK